jgi:hypothetical protein
VTAPQLRTTTASADTPRASEKTAVTSSIRTILAWSRADGATGSQVATLRIGRIGRIGRTGAERRDALQPGRRASAS